LSVLALATSKSWAARDPVGRLVSIRGKRLYVEDSGPHDAPALLYLHGGPGSGSFDFSLYQRVRLSKTLRLIVIDQRGVLRSDAIADKEPFGVQDLVDDCEALRAHLGLAQWAVLGHSFGGYLALDYAAQHPERVNRVLFENPAWSFDLSARYLMRVGARALQKSGKEKQAKQALVYAEAPATMPADEVWDNFSNTMNTLGPAKDDIYVHGPDKHFFDGIVKQSGLSKENWSRGGHQQSLLYKEKKVFVSLVPRLHDLKMPALLLKGRYDAVTGPDQIAAFLHNVPNNRMVVFENSAHFDHVEEADRFAAIVSEFVRTGTVAASETASTWSGVS
jgi:proline iminopeptidase